MEEKYLKLSVEKIEEGLQNKDGGPFGAVITDKDGNIIAVGNNEVLKNNDPTCHAEIVTIRKACQKLGTYDLKDCIIYSSSEPCPMCLSAIIWSNIKDVYYGTTRKEVEEIGFRDKLIYDYLEKKETNILNIKHIECNECKEILKKYKDTIY